MFTYREQAILNGKTSQKKERRMQSIKKYCEKKYTITHNQLNISRRNSIINTATTTKTTKSMATENMINNLVNRVHFK